MHIFRYGCLLTWLPCTECTRNVISGWMCCTAEPLNWISHMLMTARLIQSQALCMIYLLQKIKTATRNNIDNEKSTKHQVMSTQTHHRRNDAMRAKTKEGVFVVVVQFWCFFSVAFQAFVRTFERVASGLEVNISTHLPPSSHLFAVF